MNTIRALSLLLLIAFTASADDWPQWLGPKRDSVWRESGIVEKLPAGGPKLRWRTPIAGGYAGPAVANGRVYVMDRVLKPGAEAPANQFARGQTPASERVLCLDETTGKIVWQHEYDCAYTVSYPAGPRTTAAIDGGKVYTLGAEGNLFCLNADDGKVVWSRDLKKDYSIDVTPVWGFASNPLIDGRKLISFVGGEGTALVAFDKETGKELWRALSETGRHLSGYGSPIIVEAGGRRQLIAWHPEALSALDPETGKALWSQPFQLREGLSLATPRAAGDRLFVSAFYDGSLMMQLDPNKPAATQVWRRKGSSEKNTDALHCLICTPYFDGPNIYGVDSYGQLRCLDAATGDRLWESFAATGASGSGLDRWAMAFLVKQADRFFLFNEKGELIIARLTPKGYEEISRAKLLEPTNSAQRRQVVWSHPAFANRNVYARNDKEIVSYSLAAP
jgi:outer membrane protein assembly factor BamB